MFPTLILSSFVGGCLPESVVDRMVSQRVVVVERQVKLEVVICQGDPLGSKEAGTLDLLSRPTLLLRHKQTGFFEVGRATGQGIAFRATPQLRLDGKIGLECETQFTTVNPGRGLTTASGFIPGLDSEVTKATTVVIAGKPHKVRLSAKSATEQMWIEMTATVVEPQLANSPRWESKNVPVSVSNGVRVDPCVVPAGYVSDPMGWIIPPVPMMMPAKIGK